MRVRAKDAVGADKPERVREQRAHHLFARVVIDHRYVEPRVVHKVERGDHGMATALIGDLGQRPADRFGTCGCGLRDEYSLRPARDIEVLPTGQASLDVGDDPCARLGVLETREHFRGAPGERPGRQQHGKDRRAGAVRVLVEAEIDLAGGAVQKREQRLHQFGVTDQLEVGEVQRSASPSCNSGELVDRLQHASRLVAHVRDEWRADAGRLVRDGFQLFRCSVEAGQVDHPKRQGTSARFKAGADNVAHAAQLGRVGRAVVAADHEVPHRAMPDRRNQRRRRAGRRERFEVFVEGRPFPGRRPDPSRPTR